MSQPTITTKLVRGDQAVPAGPSVPVAGDGTAIAVNVPPGLEIVDAALAVQVPDDAAPVELTTDAAITTSTGVWPGPDTNKLAWICCDWRARRAVVSLTITLKTGYEATFLRLRVSDEGGPWVLASPAALIAVGAATTTVRFPALAASRVMIELVKAPQKAPNGPEDYVFADSVVTAIGVLGSRRPPALTVSVAPATVVHHAPALLPPSAVLTCREPLLAALRKALPEHTGGLAQIVVRAPVACELRRLTLSLGARVALTRWAGAGASLELPVVPGVAAIATLPLDVHPTSFTARVLADLRREQPPAVPPEPARAAWAHGCDATSALAQGFRLADGGALVGVDLYLAVRSASLRGRVEIHVDEHGGPGPLPIASVDLERTGSASVLAAPAWLGVDLAAPVTLAPRQRFWIALIVAEGEALWILDQRPAEGPVDGLLRREREAAWVPRDMTFPTGPVELRAVARPRLRHDGPPLPLTLSLARGDVSVPVVADGDGVIRLDAAGLAPLNAGAPGLPLVLSVLSPSAGRVTLRDLNVDLPAQSASWNFGSAP